MGFGFRKSIKIAPGVRLNVGKKSVGLSAGVKGFRYNVNSKTGRRVSASIPGTGISYSTSLNTKSRSNAYQQRSELIRRQREWDRLQDLERAKLEVDTFLNKIERIHSIHKEADDAIDWYEISQLTIPDRIGEKEQIALRNKNNYKPSFIDKIFKNVEKKQVELDRLIVESRKEDTIERQQKVELKITAEKVIQGDEDVYLELFEEMEPFNDLTEFGSGFEISVVSQNVIEVEFNVNGENVVPKEEKQLTKTGKLSVKAMNKTRYFDVLQDYVCSTAIRIARDSFALLPLQEVIVHAYDDVLNTGTGHHERICILSVCFNLNTLDSLNMESIDCSDALHNFEHRMNFKKTKGFMPVEPLQSN